MLRDEEIAEIIWRECRTLGEVVEELTRFVEWNKSLAWSPRPPREAIACDCRPFGGGIGAIGDREAEWIRARFRWRKWEREKNGAQTA